MQTKNHLVLLCLFFLCLGCSGNQHGVFGNLDDNTVTIRDTVYIRDTIFVYKKVLSHSEVIPLTYVAIARNSLPADGVTHLTLTRIAKGCAWRDEQGNEVFYQLLFGSAGENFHMNIEKIGFTSGDGVYLVNRMAVYPQVFGQSWYRFPPELIKWISPTVVRLLIDRDKEYDLDIPAMTATAVSL